MTAIFGGIVSILSVSIIATPIIFTWWECI